MGYLHKTRPDKKGSSLPTRRAATPGTKRVLGQPVAHFDKKVQHALCRLVRQRLAYRWRRGSNPSLQLKAPTEARLEVLRAT